MEKVIDSDTPLVEDVTPQGTKQIDLNQDLSTGYVIGLTQDGSFLFQVLGTNPGLAELQGLHDGHAAEQLRQLYNSKQMTAETVTIRMLNDIIKQQAEISQQLVAVSEQLSMLLNPKTDEPMPEPAEVPEVVG